MTRWAIGIDPSTFVLAFVGGDAEVSDPELYPLLRPIRGKSESYTCVVTNRAYVAVGEFAGTMPIAPGDTVLVGVESGIVGRGGVKTSLLLGYVSGAIQAACQQLKFQTLLVPIGTWKKELTGNGGADKAIVAEHLREYRRASYDRLCQEPGGSGGTPRQDLLDALGVQSSASRIVRAQGSLERTGQLPREE